jgi:hypothetical protein
MKTFLVILCVVIFSTMVWGDVSSSLEENGLEKTLSRKPMYNKQPLGRAPVLLIPQSTDDVVGMYDPYDGTYLGDIIIDDSTGVNYDLQSPINAIQGPDNNIYLADQVSDAVFVFDSLGNYIMTYADASDTLNNIRGIDFRNGHLFVTSGDDYVAEFDGPHNLVRYFIQDGSDPFDILFLDDGRSLLCDIQGSTDNVRLYDTSGTLLYEIFPIMFPEQVQNDPILPGAFLNASFSDNLITDFDLDSTITDQFSFSSGRGVYRLGNGNLLVTNNSGVFELDSATGAQVEQENTGSARFIELYDVPTSIEEGKGEKPGLLKLSISPNPFTSLVRISLVGEPENRGTGKTEIKIYDVAGRRVRDLFLYPSSFFLETTWDGRDEMGKVVSPGIYFISVNGSVKQKVVKIR